MKRLGITLAGILCWFTTACNGAATSLTAQERAGEAIFLTGSSPSRNPVVAVTTGANRLPGSAAACAGCHGRDGSGRQEGNLAAPDIRWSTLARSGRRDLPAGRSTMAYDDKALARAITLGIDSSGNTLAAAMPRFEFYANDLDALIAYLRRMHEQTDPGIAGDSVNFGALMPLSGQAAAQGKALKALLQNGLDEINRRGGLHGRRLELSAVDANAPQAEAELERLASDSLALLTPYAPPLNRAVSRTAAAGVPVIAPVTGPEPDGVAPLFSSMPAQRHVFGALVAYWSQLPDSRRGTLTVVTGDSNRQSMEDSLRNLLPQSARVDFRSAGELAGGAGAGDWILLDASPGLIAAVPGHLRDRNILATSATIAGAPANALSTAAAIIVASPLLPPRDDPVIRKAEELLRRSKIEAPPAIVVVQAQRALALIEESLRVAGRDLSRERLVQALEGVAGLSAPGGPLSFGPRQRFGARGAALFSMEPQTGRVTPLRAWVPSL